jgi:hypothetical protein
MATRIRCWTRVVQGFLAWGFSALVSLMGCGTASAPNSVPQKSDAHWLPVSGDTDADLLSDAEEVSLGYSLTVPDENGNLVPDGAALAASVSEWVAGLPEGPVPGEPGRVYKVTHAMRGLTTCDVCGEVVNMGYVEVVDPTAGTSRIVPFISLHYMSRGSFTAQPDPLYPERVDVAGLSALRLSE